MSENNSGKLITALIAALIIAVVSIVLPKLIFEGAGARIFITQGVELALSLLAILILGKGRFREYGFRLPRQELILCGGFALSMIGALVLGAAATMAVLITGAMGNPVVKDMSFPQIILNVWILSSTIEEIFTRGFLQGHLSFLDNKEVRVLFFKVNMPTFISAIFFACMHLVLILSGVDYKTIIIILIFTFSLGLIAGHQRARTGSLIPAIGAHMLGNIGGVVGGIIYSIYTILTGGTLPGM